MKDDYKVLLDGSYYEDEFYGLHEQACYALGELGDNRAVEPLIKILEDQQNEDIRMCACDALEKLKAG
jgi:HEAT repeat protein